MTKSIKELYDQGQRQFPMRGGGISPVLEWDYRYGFFTNKKETRDVIWCVEGRANLEKHFDDPVGGYVMGFSFDYFNLLPEPLPDLGARLERIEKAWNEYTTIPKTGDISNDKKIFKERYHNLASAIRGE